MYKSRSCPVQCFHDGVAQHKINLLPMLLHPALLTFPDARCHVAAARLLNIMVLPVQICDTK